ncbi:MAG: tripartite tricarboxylate transporter TctB family protein [Candidatus Rokubacteria bacterium]|nr:tripartite tricarboxylate transporter TctB family protein [Candidatus Rokubacteria bacterium]
MLARALPLVVLIAAGIYLSLAIKLPYGATARPGAGFYPTLVAVFACLVGLVAAAQAFFAPRPARAVVAADAELPGARRRVFSTVGALAVSCFVLPWIGYVATAFLFVTVVLRALGSRWPAALVIGGVSAAVSFYLFAVLLDVPLPRGVW